MNRPKISVIIPVYNAEKFLCFTLDSVLSQTLHDIEMICVDDGSTDGSLRILKSYQIRDSRVVVMKQENQGAAAARNNALAVASGEFVSFMDSDDLYASQSTLHSMYEAAKQHNVDICGGNLRRIDQHGNRFQGNPDVEDHEKAGMRHYRDYQCDYGFQRYIYRREFLKSHHISFPCLRIQEDPVFFLEAMAKAGVFYAMAEVVYLYRAFHKSVTWSPAKVVDYLKGIEIQLAASKRYGLEKVHTTNADRLILPYFLDPVCCFLNRDEVVRRFLSAIAEISWQICNYTARNVKEAVCKNKIVFRKRNKRKNLKFILKKLRRMQMVAELSKLPVKKGEILSPASVQEGPAVSVVVPVYNVEPYLAKCLDSIIGQTYSHLEIICVNDGSTDHSARILEQYQELDNRIRVITQENGGLSAARNTGMKHATSPYIMFVDSDDWLERDAVETSLKALLASPDVDFVCLGVRLAYEDNLYRYSLAACSNERYHTPVFEGKFSLDDSVIAHTVVVAWGKLYKMDLIKKFGIEFPQGLLYEDNAFFYMYVSHAKNAYYIPRPRYNYLQRESSIMGRRKHKARSPHYVDRMKNFEIVYRHYCKYGLSDKHQLLFNSIFKGFLYNDYESAARSDKKRVLSFAREIANSYPPYVIGENLASLLRRKKYHKIDFITYKRLRDIFFSKKVKGNGNIKKWKLLGLTVFCVKKSPYRKKISILGIPVWKKFYSDKCLLALEGQYTELTARLSEILQILNRQNNGN